MNNLKPNPIFARDNTLEILDGWEFSFDNKKWQPINVPFCPQSHLSGIGYTDFIRECFYRRKLTAEANGKRIMLHFGAVDYRCSLYVNGKYVGGHTGGYTPFALDITDFTYMTKMKKSEPAVSSAGEEIPLAVSIPALPVFGNLYGWNGYRKTILTKCVFTPIFKTVQ